MVAGSLSSAVLAVLVAQLGSAPKKEPAPPQAEPAPPSSPWYWDEERARIFAAGRVGLGASAYAELDLGYGKPFWMWAGFQGWALATTESAMVSGGFKIGLPILELSGGLRFVSPFERGPLVRQESYDSAALERTHEDARPYTAFDLDVIGYVPLPHVVLAPQVGFHYIGEQRSDLYEEEQRVVMGAPWLWYGKLTTLITWAEARRYGLGPAVEHFRSGRSRATTRLGPTFTARFTPHLDAIFMATVPVAGPDSLSFYDSLGGSMSLRYRWASSERAPSFP